MCRCLTSSHHHWWGPAPQMCCHVIVDKVVLSSALPPVPALLPCVFVPLRAVSDLTNPLAIAARNAMFWAVVAVNGTIPSDWLWQYDCQAMVDGDKG